MTIALPPDLARALDRTTWPDAVEARGLLTRGSRGDTRVALVRWAFDVTRTRSGAAPTWARWAAMLGIGRATLVGERGLWRRCAPDLVPTARAPGPPRRPAAELTAESARVRDARDKSKAEPKKRRSAAEEREAKKQRSEEEKQRSAWEREAAARLRAVVAQRAAERAKKRRAKTATA